MKICTIIGARPQFIKAATVSRVIESTTGVEEVIIHTGQHYDNNMSEKFFTELNIPKPRYYLNIGSGSHGMQTGNMLISTEKVLLNEKPDYVLVYGDTNTTLAGSLAAAKLNIPVAHVEAGLRSFNRKMPEEINRIMTDHISSLLFVPSKSSYHQLINEGIDPSKIFNVGDVMYDAVLYYNQFNANRKTILHSMDVTPKSYVLATVHRAENTDNKTKLIHIFNALDELAQSIIVICPLHPRTRKKLLELDQFKRYQRHIKLVEPVGYLDMLALEQHAQWIVTDSGGVQKEAYFNSVPCITVREESEWIELNQSGWNKLCSAEKAFSIIELASQMETKPINKINYYGSGQAAADIVKCLTQSLI